MKTDIENLEDRVNKMESILESIQRTLSERGNDGICKSSVSMPNETKVSNLTWIEREKIDDIMRDFDFDKVHDVMEHLGWTWAMTKNGTPTVDEMKKEAFRLLFEACEEKTCVSTGGFRAVYEKGTENDPDPYIGLEFILEDCEGFVNDDDDSDGSDDWDRGCCDIKTFCDSQF